MYKELFATHWKEEKGTGRIGRAVPRRSSGKQALEVANGLQADVVTLAPRVMWMSL